ncbi:MAG: hypothetical protein M1519_04400, partial [Actinobacteria bacterium]|nr:hypothetical protein [Actinomycetota bacterium]
AWQGRQQVRQPLIIPLSYYFMSFGTPSKVEIGWRKGTKGGGYEIGCTYTCQLASLFHLLVMIYPSLKRKCAPNPG